MALLLLLACPMLLTYCNVLLQFNMPIEVSWEYMDTQLLQRFWSGHPQLQMQMADISERILVFHRGIHTVRYTSMHTDFDRGVH